MSSNLKNKNANILLRRLWKQITAKRKMQLVAVLALMIVAAFSEVASIGAIAPFIAALTSPEWIFSHEKMQPALRFLGISAAKEMLLPLTIAFIGIIFFTSIIRMVLFWAQTHLGYAIGYDLSSSIYRKTLYQPFTIHMQRNTSEVVAAIASKADYVVGQTVVPCMVMVSSFLLLSAITMTMIAIDPLIAMMGLCGFGVIYIAVAIFFRRKLEVHSKIISKEGERIIKLLHEALGGIRDVLIDGAQGVYCKMYRNADKPFRHAQASVNTMIGVPKYAIEGLGMIFIALIAYNLSVSSATPQKAIPLLGVLALGAQRILPVLQQAYASWTSIRAGRATLEDTLNLLEQALPVYASEETRSIIPILFTHEIELENISFSYAKSNSVILKNVNLVIKKGARVGIVGATGSGKSTLLDVIMGLLQPTRGRVLIDGTPLDIEDKRAWQACIAHVPQAIFLADTTVAENIAFGIPLDHIDMHRVRESARKARIDSVIEGMPDGYSAKIGEQGVWLSGGQRQRLGIARALYKNAKVIIFDEATSALDTATEKSLMESIESLNKDLTLILVTHRLSTISGCNQIIKLESGVVQNVTSGVEDSGIFRV